MTWAPNYAAMEDDEVTIEVDLHEEMAIYDSLPPDIRQALRELPGIFAVTELKEAGLLDLHPYRLRMVIARVHQKLSDEHTRITARAVRQ